MPHAVCGTSGVRPPGTQRRRGQWKIGTLAVGMAPVRQTQKRPPRRRPFSNCKLLAYRVDSISKPQASSKGSGMYFEFLFRRAHSRSRVERRYWSGVSLYSLTTCSNSVTVGTMGPMGSGFPQLGLPRRFAMKSSSPVFICINLDSGDPTKDSDPHALNSHKIALLTDLQNELRGRTCGGNCQRNR